MSWLARLTAWQFVIADVVVAAIVVAAQIPGDRRRQAQRAEVARLGNAVRAASRIEDAATVQLLNTLASTDLSPAQRAAFAEYQKAIEGAHRVLTEAEVAVDA